MTRSREGDDIDRQPADAVSEGDHLDKVMQAAALAALRATVEE